MDNQQERLIWLAGFIDGEGYLGMRDSSHWHKDGAGKKYRQLEPRFSLVNTSIPALRLVEQIFEENGFAFHISWTEPGKHRLTRWRWNLEIMGVKRMKRFLEVVMPYLVVKQPQAEILYKYCKRRLRTVMANGTRNAQYNKTDFAYLEKVRQENQFPQRLYAEHLKREDIVRALAKAREVGRNDQPHLFGDE